MDKVLYIPEDDHWNKVTTLLFRAGLKYTPSRDTFNARKPINTLVITREFMWLTSGAENSDAVTIDQNEMCTLSLLEHNPEAALEWLFSL